MKVSAIILAGGLATRMGGVDKGLALLHNKPLTQHVVSRLIPQVDEIIINANRQISQYQAWGYPVYQDESSEFLGPLAGLQLGLKYAKNEYILSVPCDSPFFPLNLSAQLLLGLTQAQADIAVAKSGDDVHPVFCLCKKNLLADLETYIAQGGRKVRAWQQRQSCVEINVLANELAFTNINSLDELSRLEKHYE